MKKIITINDPMRVKAGDKVYFKDCDFGFAVIGVDTDDEDSPIVIYNPLSGLRYWAYLSRFDHATREVEEPEWPEDPKDDEVHWYKDSDGGIIGYEQGYWYMSPFTDDGKSREDAMKWYRDALPLTELKLVPAKDDDNE